KMSKVPEDPADAAPVTTLAGGNGGSAFADLGRGSSLGMTKNHVEAKKVGMTTPAEVLTPFVRRPVFDKTNLTGRFDFDPALSPEDYQGMMIRAAVTAGIPLPPDALQLLDRASSASLVAALNRVGLTLESRRAPLDVIVVDHIEQPTPD